MAIEVALSDFAIEPATISVPADTPVGMTVMNHGEAPHTFAVSVVGSSIETDVIDPGGEARLDLSALAEGTYDALCTVHGHADLGMVATVAAGADSTSPSPQASMPADQMAAMHEQGVKDFLVGEQTDTQGGQILSQRSFPTAPSSSICGHIRSSGKSQRVSSSMPCRSTSKCPARDPGSAGRQGSIRVAEPVG